jgi:hypothetical protein
MTRKYPQVNPEPSDEAVPPPDWSAPEPHRLPALREALLDQMRNPLEFAHQVDLMRRGAGTVNPHPLDPERSARVLMADETRRLRGAQLYLITPEMTSFAQQAGAKLPGWNVRREDLPCPNGFAVFGQPLGWYIKEDDTNVSRPVTISIVAVSWGPTDLGGDDNLWISFWSATDFDLQTQVLRQHCGLSADRAREYAYKQRADLTWDNEVVLNYNEDGFIVFDHWATVDVAEEQVATLTTAPWVNTLRATWLLMKQPKMSETEEMPQPRNVRRRAERLNLDSSPVKVVYLHRGRRRPAHTSSEGYTQTVQYPVSGHWRQQPYPARDTVERIWIDEHIRGPEGAPFRPGKRFTVKVLDRPPR